MNYHSRYYFQIPLQVMQLPKQFRLLTFACSLFTHVKEKEREGSANDAGGGGLKYTRKKRAVNNLLQIC